jgi:MEMO1 family protein
MFPDRVNGVVNMKKDAFQNIIWIFAIAASSLFLLFSGQGCKPQETAQPGGETSTDSSQQQPDKSAQVVLKSALAGQWYPADKDSLNKEIDGLYSKTEPNSIDNVIALILPHAGYRYSGRTAAMALQTVKWDYKRIIIIGPSHYVSMEDTLSVPKVTHYQTPLGLVPVDTKFIDKLLQHPEFQEVPQTNEREHSVQIEIPLVQQKWKDAKIVPIVAGQCSLPTISNAASILNSLIDRDTLVIASSDFVHYGPNYDYVPFTKDVPEQLKKLDMGAYQYIEQKDSKGFLEYREKTGATICGSIPIAILLSMLDKSSQPHLIQYTTSGQVTGDFTNSVSYFGVAFSGQWPTVSPVAQETSESELTKEDKDRLLKFARQSIVYFLEKGNIMEVSETNLSERLKTSRAAFVTLNTIRKTGYAGPRKEIKELRGCIGDIFPRQPLYKSVITNAVNAAVNDPRFKTVRKEELKDITIEISALTPPRPVGSAEEIRIGIDGVVLRKDGYSAVFLPQVASEQGWTRDEMLEYLSQKAGLSADAWKEGARFLTFQAEVFGEDEK